MEGGMRCQILDCCRWLPLACRSCNGQTNTLCCGILRHPLFCQTVGRGKSYLIPYCKALASLVICDAGSESRPRLAVSGNPWDPGNRRTWQQGMVTCSMRGRGATRISVRWMILRCAVSYLPPCGRQRCSLVHM